MINYLLILCILIVIIYLYIKFRQPSTPISTTLPTSSPIILPTILPTTLPSSSPTSLPTSSPIILPTTLPTSSPTTLPTKPSYILLDKTSKKLFDWTIGMPKSYRYSFIKSNNSASGSTGETYIYVRLTANNTSYLLGSITIKNINAITISDSLNYYPTVLNIPNTAINASGFIEANINGDVSSPIYFLMVADTPVVTTKPTILPTPIPTTQPTITPIQTTKPTPTPILTTAPTPIPTLSMPTIPSDYTKLNIKNQYTKLLNLDSSMSLTPFKYSYIKTTNIDTGNTEKVYIDIYLAYTNVDNTSVFYTKLSDIIVPPENLVMVLDSDNINFTIPDISKYYNPSLGVIMTGKLGVYQNIYFKFIQQPKTISTPTPIPTNISFSTSGMYNLPIFSPNPALAQKFKYLNTPLNSWNLNLSENYIEYSVNDIISYLTGEKSGQNYPYPLFFFCNKESYPSGGKTMHRFQVFYSSVADFTLFKNTDNIDINNYNKSPNLVNITPPPANSKGLIVNNYTKNVYVYFKPFPIIPITVPLLPDPPKIINEGVYTIPSAMMTNLNSIELFRSYNLSENVKDDLSTVLQRIRTKENSSLTNPLFIGMVKTINSDAQNYKFQAITAFYSYTYTFNKLGVTPVTQTIYTGVNGLKYTWSFANQPYIYSFY